MPAAELDLTEVAPTDLPMALAAARHAAAVGDRLVIRARSSDADPGLLAADHLRAVIEAGAFSIGRTAGDRTWVTAVLGLPDHVGADMRLLCCGLNPSVHSAEAGIGYVMGSNRYWKAMLAAGLATVDRDPTHLLAHHAIGMTDLVKRPTPRADQVSSDEFRTGVQRLERLCSWLQPAAVAVVGLAGWRAGLDRKAVPGWQARTLGPSPVYVLPSTSGLNATTSLADLVAHLHAAAAGPRRGARYTKLTR